MMAKRSLIGMPAVLCVLIATGAHADLLSAQTGKFAAAEAHATMRSIPAEKLESA